MSIAFEELEGSPRVAINQNGVTATRVFRVAWDEWQAFAQSLVGVFRMIGLSPEYVSPVQFPGLPNLVVTDIQVEPFDPRSPDGAAGVSLGARTNAYPSGGARITATYRTLLDFGGPSRRDLPQIPNGTILNYSAELASEYLYTPARTWRWSTGGGEPLAEDINPGVLIPTGAFQLTWRRVPAPPWNAIRKLRGKVNDAAFVSAPAGTVMFAGARVTREFQFLEEDGLWRLEYTFNENVKTLSDGLTEVGWNYLYRHEAVAGEHWVQIVDEDGNSPYPAADFNDLFQFE